MLKTSFLSAIILTVFTAFSVKAQSRVDAGISTHNYKHPNKAAQAKMSQPSIKVATINNAEAYYKRQRGGIVNSTPKYANRPATLIVIRKYEMEGNDLNPLLSPRNYKTPTSFVEKRSWEIATTPNASDSTYLPTVD